MKSTVVLALIVCAGASRAAELPAPFRPCVPMKRDAERLACYDHAVQVIESGEHEGNASTAEDLFGANAAMTGATATRSTRPDVKQISATVTSARRTSDGMMVLTLGNGQVWRQEDSQNTLFIEPGDTVTVVRASLGTFRITDKRGRSARFQRTQ